MKIGKTNCGLIILVLTGVLGMFLLRDLPRSTALLPWRARAQDLKKRPFYAVPGTELTMTRLVGHDRGRRTWELRARRIHRTIDGSLIEAGPILDGIIYSGGKVGCAFQAGRVRYEVPLQRLDVDGGLSGRLDDGTVFTAQAAVVDLRRNILTISGTVKASGPEIAVQAGGLTADLTAQIVTLQGNVTVRWPGGTVHANEAVYSVKDGAFFAQGNNGEGVDITL